ncbi:MAG TPA: serine O-acetyltransferase, partial [Brevibacterium sp.]|nr:serine O-acetyltransferase [Brevibacterium sp.]
AKLIGPVEVGADAAVGANAVVVKDVAAGGTAVGVPATVKFPKSRPLDAEGHPTPDGVLTDPALWI